MLLDRLVAKTNTVYVRCCPGDNKQILTLLETEDILERAPVEYRLSSLCESESAVRTIIQVLNNR